MEVVVHPQLGLLCGAALLGFFLSEKQNIFRKKTVLFYNERLFFHQNGPNSLLTRNHYQNQHSGACRILVGTLDPWNGRSSAVPWPILFERVVSKLQNSRRYLLVRVSCTRGRESSSAQNAPRLWCTMGIAPAMYWIAECTVHRMDLCICPCTSHVRGKWPHCAPIVLLAL